MPKIVNRTSCSSNEINNIIKFLESDRNAWPLNLFIKNGAVVSTGKITSLRELAETRTNWSNRGGMQSKKEYQSKFFLVCQVFTVLSQPQCKTGQKEIEDFEGRIKNMPDNYHAQITLFEKDNKIIICDGNHSAVAWFEYYSRHGSEKIDLNVFIITFDTNTFDKKLKFILLRPFIFLRRSCIWLKQKCLKIEVFENK